MSAELKSTRKQHTIAGSVRVSGFGYWSGIDSTVEFRPAKVNSGITFYRIGSSGETSIQANVFNRIDVPRRTNLKTSHAQVDMVEHILASLSGLQIDNCDIYCTSQEMPGCDGSSRSFVDALVGVGIIEQQAARLGLVIARPVKVGTADSWVVARPLPDAGRQARTVLHYHLDYGDHCVITAQQFRTTLTPDSFVRDLSPARTFVLEREADEMRANGLGLKVSTSDLIVFGEQGPIDTQLRFPDECARHKVLDMVGDFALAGCDLIGEFEAYKAGHRLNAELIREVLAVHNLSTFQLRCA